MMMLFNYDACMWHVSPVNADDQVLTLSGPFSHFLFVAVLHPFLRLVCHMNAACTIN